MYNVITYSFMFDDGSSHYIKMPFNKSFSKEEGKEFVNKQLDSLSNHMEGLASFYDGERWLVVAMSKVRPFNIKLEES